VISNAIGIVPFIVFGLRRKWAGNLVVIKRELFHLGFASVPTAAPLDVMLLVSYDGADYKYSSVDFLLVPLG
jgi:hypothetical protein